MTLKYTLIGDGSSDEALIYIIQWLLNDLYPTLATEKNFADFGNIRNPPPKGDIQKQIAFAKRFYPFDILFYHRDAESTDFKMLETRKSEILLPLPSEEQESIVCIIPIKMTEAWLLIDETAIKRAAGNRNYKENLSLPNINSLEANTQPKEILQEILRKASGLKGRRLKNFNANQATQLVAENIKDYSKLRSLAAFKEFEFTCKTKVGIFLQKHGQ